MRALHRVTAALAAATLAFTTATAPSALGAEKQPADIAGNAAASTISEQVPEIKGSDPVWRTKVKKASEDANTQGRIKELQAISPSMNRTVPLVVVKAKSPNSPTYYLLNGAGGGDQKAHDWVANTDALQYFLEQDVNLVIPMAGMFSYYIDWVQSPGGQLAKKGEQKWETFLTKELPGPLERYLGANGKRAISGMSMSATSSLLLAQHNQGFYDAVGSFSGCAETSTPMGYAFAGITVNRAGENPERMWGPLGSPSNLYQDALANAEKLRGTTLYISNGSGLIGESDTAGWLQEQGMSPQQAQVGSATLLVEGGVIEGATNVCTHNLEAKLNSLNIPATYNFNNVGTHTWTYWNADLKKSWKEVIEPALNS